MVLWRILLALVGNDWDYEHLWDSCDDFKRRVADSSDSGYSWRKGGCTVRKCKVHSENDAKPMDSEDMFDIDIDW